MAAPLYTSTDYATALQAVLPRGRAWPRDPSSVQTQVLNGISGIYEAQNVSANNLLVDAFPATTVDLLPEWEQSLGLPNPAIGPSPTTEARQILVLARFVGSFGPTAAGMVQYAAQLGYTVAVTASAPFRCGQSTAKSTLGTADQMCVWTVTTAADTSTAFGAYGLAVLQSELLRIAPAQSILIFKFV